MKIFKSNIHKYSQAITDVEKVLKRLSLFRLVSFIFSLVIISILANERLLTLLWIVVPVGIAIFLVLLARFNQLNDRKKTITFLKEVNEKELLRLENNLSGFPTGQSYLNMHHVYVADLDIFGAHSLFQLLNRTTTESGSLLLASWLSEPASENTILERQQAIKELQPRLQWRQQFQVAGMPYTNTESDHKKLLSWCEEDDHLLPKQTKYLLVNITLAISSSVLVVLTTINALTESWFPFGLFLLIVLAINSLILKRIAPIAEGIIDHTDQNIKTLGGYYHLAHNILTEKFHTQKLKNLQTNLNQNGYSAASEIRKLKKILDSFQLRGTSRSDSNKFYGLLNIFWLLDIFWIIRTERWKHRNKSQVKKWIHAISEFEVLSSLAGFAYANPDYKFPQIKDEPYHIHFENLGHPLIKSESRICNDFDISGRGQIAIITGSNMAGKSTFLRTVGVNIVLALMGAPCCAKSGEISPIKIFTSMRTQDNLEEGVSSFYAELKRVEQLLQLIRSEEPIFFMLDEMFKGTNSKDRYKGGVSLIKQLSELNAFGIISTHDLELAHLAGKHMAVSNYSFNSQIFDSEMSFNYRLTQGICKDFNASELMKKCGIKILNDIEKMR